MPVNNPAYVADIETNVVRIAHHLDSRSRVYPQVAGATITLISDGVADTFGSWTEIIPINTVDFEYKVLGVVIYGVDTASNFFIQLGYSIVDGSDPTTAQILGEREERIVDTPISKATELLDFYCSECPANAKLWGRLKTNGGATDEAYIAVTLTRHIGLVGELPVLETWPWSTWEVNEMNFKDVLSNFKWDIGAKVGIGLVKMDTRLRCRLFIPITPGGLIVPPEEIDEEYRRWLMINDHDKCPSLWREDEKSRRERRHRVITTAFVEFIVDQLIAEDATFGDFKWHECGLGVGAENITDTALGTPSGIARGDGTQVETDSDTYKSIKTITMDDTEAITEHGLFNINAAGTLMDRTLHGAINVVSGNQIEYTFEVDFTAGS